MLAPFWIAHPAAQREGAPATAICGIRRPASSDTRVSEEAFRPGIAIVAATACWVNATTWLPGDEETPDVSLEPVLRLLVGDFGSPTKSRAAALRFLDARLDPAIVDRRSLLQFRRDREALAIDIAMRRMPMGPARGR